MGVAVGAAVGQVESPSQSPAQWVAGVLSTTDAAGSAHLRFVSSTTSPGFGPTTTVGSGVVNFTNGNYRVSSRYHEVAAQSTNGGPAQQVVENWAVETIAIGQTVYSQIDSGLFPFTHWTRAHFPRDVHQAFGLDAGIGAEDAMAGLTPIAPPASVREVGPGTVDGAAATRFLVTSKPVYICGLHGRTLLKTFVGPTMVWIDDLGRLVQLRTAQRIGGSSAPKSPGAPHIQSTSGGSPESIVPIQQAQTTIVTTLTFSDFGQPASIAAPEVVTGSRSTSITLKANASTTPCNS
jgi:hypothetical protein